MFSNLLKGASEGEGMLGQSYMISVVRGKAILELTDLLTKKGDLPSVRNPRSGWRYFGG